MIDRFERIMHKLMGVKPRRDPRTSETPIYASFQDRLFASAIDVAILYLLFQDFFEWTSRRVYRDFDPAQLQPHDPDVVRLEWDEQLRAFIEQIISSGFLELWILNSFIQSLAIGVLFIAVWNQFHQTPGKFFVGLRFANAGDFSEPTLKQYIIRYLGFFLSMPVFMIGFALLGFSKTKQAWHDKLAHTVVIYSKEGSIFRRAYDVIKARITGKKPPANDA